MSTHLNKTNMETLSTPIIFGLLSFGFVFIVVVWWLYGMYMDNRIQNRTTNYLTPKMEKKFRNQFLKKLGEKVT